MNNIFDSHAHYNDEQYDSDRDSLLASLNEAGIVGIINCGTDIPSSVFSVELSKKYPFIYTACGFHPSDADKADDEAYKALKKLLSEEKCVAIGEIGLDYHYDFVPKAVQLDAFEKQLIMAKELNMPVIVHDREAHEDTLNLLKKYKPHGVLHCFSGSTELAFEILKLGMYIGMGGALTFNNAKKAVNVIKNIPLDRLLLETDCPYMSPVPMRGKRNRSDYIEFVAKKAAEIRNMTAQEILDITAINTKTLFGI